MELRCQTCQEFITNPICVACVDKEIRTWLELKDKSLVKKFPKFYITSNPGNCIKCGNSADICSYCYTEQVYDWIKENCHEYLSEFLIYFNFGMKYEIA